MGGGATGWVLFNMINRFAANGASTADASLAKGGLNGRHRPPLPCDLPMGGFPYEFGPETGR